MRMILFGATVALAIGLAYSGNSIHAETSERSVTGKVTAFYGDDIIAVEGHRGHIVLSGFSSEDIDIPAKARRGALRKMIGNGPVTCRHESYDEYGRMVAACQNTAGQALTRDAALGAIAGR